MFELTSISEYKHFLPCVLRLKTISVCRIKGCRHPEVITHVQYRSTRVLSLLKNCLDMMRITTHRLCRTDQGAMPKADKYEILWKL